jgi:hypothetical protein
MKRILLQIFKNIEVGGTYLETVEKEEENGSERGQQKYLGHGRYGLTDLIFGTVINDLGGIVRLNRLLSFWAVFINKQLETMITNLPSVDFCPQFQRFHLIAFHDCWPLRNRE